MARVVRVVAVTVDERGRGSTAAPFYFLACYTKQMKLSRPIIPPLLEDGSLTDMLEGSLEQVQVTGDATKYTIQALGIDSVVLDRMSFLQAQLPRIAARDLIAKQSDFFIYFDARWCF